MEHDESTAARSDDPNRIIRREIQRLGDEVRARHPWLAHQDGLGLSILLASALGIVGLGILYAYRLLPWWLVLPGSAFLLSILHELEHDLIHRLYFRRNERLYDFAMGLVWLFRPSTVSPWVRKDWHLHHHKVSGNESDFEERAITNGVPWSVRRFFMMSDGLLAVLLRPKTVHAMGKSYVASQKPRDESERRTMANRLRRAFLPIGPAHYVLLYTWVGHHVVALVAHAAGHPFATSSSAFFSTLDFLAVVWLLPNVLRTMCLHFVSSNIHYYGDVAEGNIVQQTQVWTSPLAWPVQLFCFNFGSTHAIHHFVVRDPFYLRQMIASDAHAVMRANGVRFDDFGTFARANRYALETPVHG